VKVRDASLAELAPKPPKVRPMSPRQLSIRKRELVIGRALSELSAGPKSLIKRIELEDGEKLPTIRAAIVKQIRAERSNVKVAVRNGAIYLSVGPLAGRPQAGS
jgi:hypothetical protein